MIQHAEKIYSRNNFFTSTVLHNASSFSPKSIIPNKKIIYLIVMQRTQWQANNAMQYNFVLTTAIIYEYSYDTSAEANGYWIG